MNGYSRYNRFIRNGSQVSVPFIEVPKRSTDCYVYYDKSSMRLDLLSYQYYNDPNYGWLILQANPRLGAYEFNIDDKTQIRIPYPLEAAIQGYEESIDMYDRLYGLGK